MLNQLIKYEFKATFKNFLLMFAILIFLAGLSKLLMLVKIDTPWYHIFTTLFYVVDVILLICVSFGSAIMVVMRIYKNMLKDEGYLTHTLPVKTWQHLFAKGLVGTVWIILTFFVLFISVSLFFFDNDDYWNGLRDIVSSWGEYYSKSGWFVVVSILLVIILITQVVLNINCVMAALSLGQMFSKHRIAGSVLFWIIINYATGTVTGLGQQVVGPLIEDMGSLSRAQFKAAVLLGLIGIWLFDIIVAAIYFFIANYRMSKKLNLE